MRQLLILAAAFGIAATAYADGPKAAAPAPAAPAAPVAEGEVFYAKELIKMRYASMRIQQGDCIIQVAFTVDGRLIQVMGRAASGNGRGILFEPNRYSPVPDNQYSMGSFMLVGNVNDQAVLIEVRDPVTGFGIMGIFETTNNRTGLEFASGWMKTDGFAIDTFNQDVRTAGLNADNLVSRFERSSGAAEFLTRLARRQGVPDVYARPTCQGDCGGHTVAPIGAPIVPGVIVTPFSRSRDSSLSGYPRY